MRNRRAIASATSCPILTEGLKRLEYRGYDSAGIAVLNGGIKRVRRVGRVVEMENAVRAENLQGILGIAHTRWATHGGVTEPNAHPHVSTDEIAVVHNGIIENHEEQRAQLVTLGYVFASQTDTEVIAHLVHYYFKQSGDLFAATQKAASELHGAYAIGVVALNDPDTITGARKGCPLVVGIGEGENFLASDVSALIAETKRVMYLDDGDVVAIRRGGVEVDAQGAQPVQRKVQVSQLTADAIDLGHLPALHAEGDPRAAARGRRHHRRRDQRRRRRGRPVRRGRGRDLPRRGFGADPRFRHQLLLGAGGQATGSRRSRRSPCNVELGHEYRYRDSIPNTRQLVVTISQSGETLDTMEALKRAKELGHERTLSICNVRESAIPRASRLVFYTRAGAEIGVASTKAFTTQLVSLFTLTLALAKAKGRLNATHEDAGHRAAALRAGLHPARAQPRAADPGLGRALRRQASTRSSSAAACTTRSPSRAR